MVLFVSLLALSLAEEVCLKKNLFLLGMQLRAPANVTILPSVQRIVGNESFPHCQAEWDRHGTCCDSADLLNLNAYENKTIRHNMQQLATSVANFVAFVNASDKVAYKEETLLTLKNFSQNSEDCWTYITRVRSSALCSICSGRSEIFFTESKDKILIDSDTCRIAISKCEDFFTSLAFLSKRLPKVVDKNGQQMLANESKPLIDLSNTLKMYGPPKELIKAIEEYENQRRQANSRKAIHSAYVCSMFLNIRKKPYIIALDAISKFFAAEAELNFIENSHEKGLKKITRDFDIEENKARQEYKNLKRIQEKTYDEEKSQILRDKKLTPDSRNSSLAQLDKEFNEENLKIDQNYTKITDGIAARQREAVDALIKIYNDAIAKIEAEQKQAFDILFGSRIRIKQALLTQAGAGTHSSPTSTSASSSISAKVPEASNWAQKPGSEIRDDHKILSIKEFEHKIEIDHPRLLSEQDEDEVDIDLFASDSSVLIRPTDSMFTGFFGAPGTTLLTGDRLATPMNCSMVFP